MAGQSNLFPTPETQDPFGNPTYATDGVYQGGEKRPNIDSVPKQAAQSAWEQSIANNLNKIK